MVHDHGLGIDTKGVVNRGEELAGMNGIFYRSGTGLVGFPVHVALLNSCTRNDAGVAVRPMVAAIGAISVARCAHSFLWTAPKFAHCNNEGLVEEAAVIKIRNEGGESLVEHGTALVLDPFSEILVRIPRVVVGVGDFRPDDFDHAGASFHQAAREKAAVTEGVLAVGFAGFVTFLFKGKSFARPTTDDEIEGSLVIFIERVFFDRFVDDGHLGIDCAAQGGAPFEPQRKDVGTQLEVVDFDAGHFRHVHVIASRIEGVGIVGFSEETGATTFADDIALLKRAREHHEGKHGLLHRAHLNEIGAEIWKILWAGWLELTGWTYLVRGVAGHHLIDRGSVIEKAVGRVAHRPDHRKFIVNLGEIWKNFGKVDPWNFGRDGFEGTPDIVGDIFLRVPEIKMAGAALKVDQDDALRFSPARSAGFLFLFGEGFRLKHRAQGHAQHASPSHS